MSELAIPALSLVALIGASGSGKSTFAAEHFGPFETISSDFCRGLVSNDPNSQDATKDAFELLDVIVGKRLDAGLLTVVDATNTQTAARRSLVELAKAHDVLPVAIVLDLPEGVLAERHRGRADRDFPFDVVRRQRAQLRASLKGLAREGFRHVHVLKTPEDVEAATIVRTRLYNDRRDDHGPFDVIGDVHGCLDELLALLDRLGYAVARDDAGRPADASHPDGRRVVFLGDLVDRGPDVVGVLRLAMGMTAAGHALAVAGNHEAKLVRALTGRTANRSHGLAETLAALDAEDAEFKRAAQDWCDALIAHYLLDDGRLVVAHAGLKEAYQGRASGRVRAFALYGDTTGESDEYGLPVRYPWADDYRGKAMVLYGHTPVARAEWINNTLCLDTGCVFGGALSALRYPEKELVAVPAARVYCEPARPMELNSVGHATDRADPDRLDITDVTGKRVIETAWMGRVTVQAEQSAGALEVMSRFAAAPGRLAYLPPTMSPVETSALDGYLEHPVEAFAYFRDAGVSQVMCEEKHMGSRAVFLVRRDGSGIVHTRTGRPFFAADVEAAMLARLDAALAEAGLWDELGADWLLLDAELLPWRLKAADLVDRRYREVGRAAQGMYAAALAGLGQAAGRGLDVAELTGRVEHRRANAAAYAAVVDRFGADGSVRLAPFQVLAATDQPLYPRPHTWHLAVAARLAEADAELVLPTRHVAVDVRDEDAVRAATAWWEELTADGGEGMVVKPMASPVRAAKGLVQPGLKVRGREYLRMTYGPDYPDHLDALRRRNLGRKRSLALREYALGLEAVDRFTAGEPAWRVHECVFAVLALESEPVDPRL